MVRASRKPTVRRQPPPAHDAHVVAGPLSPAVRVEILLVAGARQFTEQGAQSVVVLKPLEEWQASVPLATPACKRR